MVFITTCYSVLALILALNVLTANCSPKIDPIIQARLDKGEKVNVLVNFDGTGDICRLGGSTGTRSVLASDRGQMLTGLKTKLSERMTNSQEGVVNLLSARSAGSASRFTQFWLTNQLFIGKADQTLIQSIAQDPKVSQILAEPVIEIPKLAQMLRSDGPKPNENGEAQPNLKHIKVPEAWNELGGKKGEGIVVGIFDTGVLHTHENLRDSWLGKYGWYDPGGEDNTSRPEPWDELGHGTHVAGFIVGAKGVGIVPEAKWSACKNCRDDHWPPCQLEDILKCAQFFTCPTLPDGTNPDCSKAPHVINNSWGGRLGGSTTYFDEMFKCWESAGIISVFAIGNYGFECKWSQYPATSNYTIGVGMCDINDTVARGSSRGPSEDGRIKPDLVAPGWKMLGPTNQGNDHYGNEFFGTSFSSPIVTGAVALLLSKHKNLSFKQVREMLQKSVDSPLPMVDNNDYQNCGNTTQDQYPNNLSGYGRINVYNLVKMEPPPA